MIPTIPRCPYTGKRIYSDRVNAQGAANGYHRKHGKGGGRKVRAYQCDWAGGGCGGWHIGHIAQMDEMDLSRK